MVDATPPLSAEPSSTGRTAPTTVKDGVGAPQPILFTRRELDVLVCGTEGLTAPETGDRLGISKRTVEIFRGTAKEKLGGRNFHHAVLLFDRLKRKPETAHG